MGFSRSDAGSGSNDLGILIETGLNSVWISLILGMSRVKGCKACQCLSSSFKRVIKVDRAIAPYP
jgi:hypothetical protein